MAFTLSGDDAIHALQPTPIPDPYWVAFSGSAAKLINLELASDGYPQDKSWLNVLAGNALDTQSQQFTNPMATVYSGHQFGVWAGQLGDGRAVLRSSIREFLCSEAMHALGIPTSRALSVVGSDLRVIRETAETAAVCARLAPSFIRVGHFEHFASTQNFVRLKELADLLIEQHYPGCLNTKDPYLELFQQISARNAKLVAQWQAVGFCHGVLNSDNISALGLTIDYGPFGFLDHFQIDHICNHSDQGGRYAYHRQPQIMHWNMACLASAFIPLLELDHSEEESQTLLSNALGQFPIIYGQTWQDLFRQKLGFITKQDDDIQLIERLLQLMHDARVDFTMLFRGLAKINIDAPISQIKVRDDFIDRDAIDQWLSDYITRLKAESSIDAKRKSQMNAVNPKYILRNHLAQAAIEKAEHKDFSEIAKLLSILEKPFDEQDQFEVYATPPPPDLESIEVSCSS